MHSIDTAFHKNCKSVYSNLMNKKLFTLNQTLVQNHEVKNDLVYVKEDITKCYTTYSIVQ